MTDKQIPQNVNGFSTDPAPVGHNGGPALLPRFNTKRWAKAICDDPDPKKTAGAEAMALKLVAEMDSKGCGAAIGDMEFARDCRISDRSVREFKGWLRDRGYVAITVKGARGRVSTYAARMPEPIAGNSDEECRKPLPAISDELPETITGNPEMPATNAGIAPSSRARGVDNNITNTNTSIGEEGEDRGLGGKENRENDPTPISALEAFELYNEMAQRIGLPIAKTLTPQRRKAMMARMREHGGIEAWKTALANVERSKFLQGTNDRSWRADLDFLCQAKSFTKVVEGSFGNGAHADAKSFEQRGREIVAEMERKQRESKQWTR